MSGANSYHMILDMLAALSAMAVTMFVYLWRLRGGRGDLEAVIGPRYALALVIGAVLGGYVFGTANLWLSGMPGIGRSVAGALLGAIAGIELYKMMAGIRGSTGVLFVAGFSASVAIGRWGCFLTGLPDYTYGMATALPWGVDFGDGVTRHPVQLYESAAMAAFLIFSLVMLARRSRFFMHNGFYLLAIWYGAQRFAWEFLKPYGKVTGPFNIFHFVCAALMAFGVWMLARRRREQGA